MEEHKAIELEVQVNKGYTMRTVFKSLFRSRLWKLEFRNPPDYPLEGFVKIFGNYYWNPEGEE